MAAAGVNPIPNTLRKLTKIVKTRPKIAVIFSHGGALQEPLFPIFCIAKVNKKLLLKKHLNQFHFKQLKHLKHHKHD